jgi:uncharacterized metal-binding protein YceD (DUF177 family)
MPAPAVLRFADLDQNAPNPFDLTLDPDACRSLAAALDLDALRKVRLQGTLQASGQRDWRLEARLGATVVQPCVVTLEPVTTRIEAPVARLYLAHYSEPDGSEVEMDEDDTQEPLPAELDLGALIAEALALNLPQYPRKPDAYLGRRLFAPPGADPLTDEAVRPFATLATLRDQLKNKS